MKPRPTKQDILKGFQDYNKKRIVEEKKRPFFLDTRLAMNPFLQGEWKYNYLINKLNSYNDRVKSREVSDPLEAMYYQRLFSIICDFSHLETRDDQITRM